MKSIFALAIATLFILTAHTAFADEEFKTLEEKLSYAIGFEFGERIKQRNIEIDLDIYMRAIKEAMKGEKGLLTKKEMQSVKTEYNNKLTKRVGDKNLEEGKKFLEENGKKEGVSTTASGLQYLVLKEGDGPKPAKEDKVRVNYRGTLLNGEEFDSSYKRKRPAEFKLTGVIKGWTEALQLMNTGSKYRLFIPPDLAYGERGSRNIQPQSTLIFEVELLAIVGKENKDAGKEKVKKKADSGS